MSNLDSTKLDNCLGKQGIFSRLQPYAGILPNIGLYLNAQPALLLLKTLQDSLSFFFLSSLRG